MEMRRLGRTGLKVSKLCLGAMTFGNPDWGCDETTSRKIVDRFLEAGGNFIDTADGYSSGVSEEILGRAIADRRQEVIVATKVFAPMGPGPNDSGLSRKHILDAVDASLRRLGTDYIDLYQVHGFDDDTPLDETLGALHDCVRAGKVRYTGCSNYFGWQLMKANSVARELGKARYDSLQPQYSLVCRAIEREIVPLCIDQGIGLVPYSPLGGGILTGKMRLGEPAPAGTRAAVAAMSDFYKDARKIEIAQEVANIADSLDCTSSQLALAWAAQQPGITSPIFGARTLEQLDDNLAAADLEIGVAAATELEEATALPLEYPADLVRSFRRLRERASG